MKNVRKTFSFQFKLIIWMKNPTYIILIGCLCSIVTEATQYLLKMGWCETDDIIHNTLVSFHRTVPIAVPARLV